MTSPKIEPSLRSRLFGNDKRLLGALTDDSKHITRGSRGPHVSKIQSAVLMLQGGHISGAELVGELYGETTARAVLEYKKRRKIINLAYQKTADDIVGKMTMQSLDDEMFRVELRDRFHDVKS